MSSRNLLERARALAGATPLIVLPLAAAAPSAQAIDLVHEYSLAGEYSNSGWFMSWLDDAAADASTSGGNLNLSGEKSINDGLFWAWNDTYNLTLRRYDVTGMAFAWGGAINGALNPGDILNATFDFTIDFTHTLPTYPTYDYTYVGWELTLGFRDTTYTPESWQSMPSSNSLTYSSAYGSADMAGVHRFQDVLQVQAQDWGWTEATEWFAVLTVDWPDALARIGYEDTHGSRNGDTLTLTMPTTTLEIVPTFSAAYGRTVLNQGSHLSVAGVTIETYGTFRNMLLATFDNQGEFYVYEEGMAENSGLFRNLAGGLFSNYGTLDNQAGASFENVGTLNNLFGGVVNNHGSFNNISSHTVNNDGLFNVYGELANTTTGVFNNNGELVIHGGGVFINAGQVNNEGIITNAGDVEIAPGGVVSGSGSYVQTAGSTWVDGLLAGGDIRFEGGELAGTGTITGANGILIGDNVVLQPGGAAALGTLTLQGEILFSGTSTLVMEINGNVQGTSYDWLSVIGGASLDGNLILELAYTLQPGEVLTLLTTSNGVVSGSFANTQINGGIGFISYGAQGVYLSLAAPVPEPETWAMLLAGLGMVGWQANKRRRRG